MDSTKKKKHKINSWIFLLLICVCTLFMGIGYAEISEINSVVSGTLIAEAQEGIFITDVKYSGNSNANIEESKIIAFHQTTLNSKVILSDTDNTSTITYSITVYNSSNISFSFIDTVFEEEFYDNENIIFELTNLKNNDTIPSKSYHTFEITFKYKEGITPSSSIDELNSFLNFKFLHPINYLGSTGTQYIDTGINPNNNTTFEMSFSLNNIEKAYAIYGTRESMDGTSYNMYLYNGISSDKYTLRWDENKTITYADLCYNEGNLINVVRDYEQTLISTNGSSVSIENPTEQWSLSSSVYIFNINQQSSLETRIAEMKLYYLKMYQDGELVRDFVPVLDRNAVPCLHDLVTNTYFYNQGTGEFEYSDKFTVAEYIESSGTQYIDTGIKADNTTRVEFVMELNEVTDDTQGVFGGRDGQVNNTFNMFMYKSQLRWDYNASIQYPSYEATLTDSTYISADAEEVTINGVTSTYDYTDTFAANYNMYIFSVNDAGNAVYPNTGMKLYYFKIIQNETLVRNFISVKDENNVACLYDSVSETYFYNKGTAEFKTN